MSNHCQIYDDLFVYVLGIYPQNPLHATGRDTAPL